MDKTKKPFNIRKLFSSVFVVLVAATIVIGCKDSATGDDGSKKGTKTYDLVLATDGSNIGKLTTERITEGSDAYINEGFFVTLNIQDASFDAPFDIHINNSNGYCGTFGVASGEKAEMPCDYDDYLSNPGQLKVTSEDGDGVEAYPKP